MTRPFRILPPETDALPLVFDSPHSGTHYPKDFDYICDFAALERAEDKFVDELFAAAPAHGAPLLCADFPRSYIDVNRCEKDIDTELLGGVWPGEINPTSRSHAGIGLIRRLVRPGLPVYNRSLTTDEIQHRIDSCYRPYHTALEKLIEDAHYRFGQVWHINCHSMPSAKNFGRPSALSLAVPSQNPDFVLGDRDGTTCEKNFINAVRDFLKSEGYTVAINDPYKGVELVRRYSNPATGRHSLQIEICKSLYMNEDTGKKSRGFDRTQKTVTRLIEFCADYVSARLMPMAAD